MPTTCSALRRETHYPSQQLTGIGKLPPEILSQIFVLCDQVCFLEFGGSYLLQARIPVVCQQWRKVALDTPMLWSRITLSEFPEYSRAALFLSRSGSAGPLDIQADMIRHFWDGIGTGEERKQRAKEALEFIVSHGGAVSRWQRFWIQTDTYQTYIATMDFLRSSQMTSLQYLELSVLAPTRYQREDPSLHHAMINSSHMALFSKAPPQLRTVKLEKIPNAHLFNHIAHSQLTSLTRLEITFVNFRPRVEHMCEMLVASGPTLVTLCLRSGDAGIWFFDSPSEASSEEPTRIALPNLRALSFTEIAYDPKWELRILRLLDAPHLEVLRIGGPSYHPFERHENYLQILNLLIHGSDKDHPNAHFPSISCLSYERRDAAPGDLDKDLHILLNGYPSISSLSLPSATRLTALLKKPLLAPELVCLRVRADALVLKKVVAARHKAGIPLKSIELNDQPAPRDLKLLEKYVEKTTVNKACWCKYADPIHW